jgi:ribosome-binding factor A
MKRGGSNEDGAAKSVRLLRVAEQIRHALAELLMRREIHDDVLSAHVVSITEVRVSPDLRHATAFVKTLGSQEEEAVIAALKRNARYMRGHVARALNTKYTPDLSFRLDESFDEASRIDALLRSDKVARDLKD